MKPLDNLFRNLREFPQGNMTLNQTWQKMAYIILACGAGAWLLACNGSNKETREESPRDMSSEIKGIAHCIGRFQFTLPEDLGVAGRTQSIYRVQVNTKPLPQDGIKGLVDTELARIQALPPPPGAPKSLIRAVDLQDGIKGFWYFSNSDDPDIREL